MGSMCLGARGVARGTSMAKLGVLAALCISIQGVVVETYRLLPANGPLLLGSADPDQPRTSHVPAKIALCLGVHVANRHAGLSGDTAESARAVAWRKLFRGCSLHRPAFVDREQWSSTDGKGARALFAPASGTLPCPFSPPRRLSLEISTRTQPAAHLPIPPLAHTGAVCKEATQGARPPVTPGNACGIKSEMTGSAFASSLARRVRLPSPTASAPAPVPTTAQALALALALARVPPQPCPQPQLA